MIYRVSKSRFVVCPQCFTPLFSRKGSFRSKTFTCFVCGVEVLR